MTFPRILAALAAAFLGLVPVGAGAQMISGGGGGVTVPFTASCATVTVSTVCWNVTETWNAAGTVFAAPLQVAVTDTASATGSHIFEVFGGAAGTTSEFSVDKAGNASFVNGGTGNYLVPVVRAAGNTTGFAFSSTNIYAVDNGAGIAGFVLSGGQGTLILKSSVDFCWGNLDINGAGDTCFWRDAAGVVDLGTATASDKTGKLQLARIGYNGTAPAITACGTSPTVVTGSDAAGDFTTGTATPTSCTLTFAAAFAATPHCIVEDRSALANLTSYTVSTTAIVLTTSAASSQNIVYHCAGV